MRTHQVANGDLFLGGVMELKDLHAKAQLDNFLCLCSKAQELIFKALQDYNCCHFFVVAGIDEEVLNMSPIEQIFYVGNFINNVSGKNFLIELEEQKEIVVENSDRKYRVDFLVTMYTENIDNEQKTYD